MNTAILYFPISALFNALVCTFFGLYLFAFTHKKEKNIAIYLIYICGAVATWSYGYLFWQLSSNIISALFWSRVLMFGAIFTALSYYHTVLAYLNISKRKIFRISLYFFYLLALVWVVADFTPYFVKSVLPISYFKFWPQAGPIFHYYLFTFFLQFFLASILLFNKYLISKGVAKQQAMLLLIGLFVAFAGGATNFFLWYGINIAPWGNIFASIYVFLTIYAIMRYGFLNARAMFADFFTGTLLVFLTVDMFFVRSVGELMFRAVTLFVAIMFSIILVRLVRKDIKQSEDKARLAALEESNVRLKELDRQKTEFLNIAAHQLRTPVSIINNYVAMLADGDYGEVNADVKQVHQNIGESNQWLVRLADEFLNIAHLEQGETKYHKTLAPVNALITTVIKEMLPKAERKGIKLVATVSPELPNVLLDEEKIRHVIFNFVDNALKYSENGEIKIIAQEKDGGVSITVSDTGMGFDTQDSIHLFEKFRRGKNASQVEVNTSTGLGLYICRKFVEGHGGKVWAKSDGVGKGSEFGFSLPISSVTK